MFPSSSNGINSSNSKYEQLQLDPSFFNPCYDDFFHNEMISLHQEILMADFVNNTGDKKEIPTIKRCSKKDRHSKINTAQGPRDRRVRLSLKVAREFFDLQDKLCFDKASKTIEWLLIQAGSAIKRLSRTDTVNQNASSTSKCEVIKEDKDTPNEAKTTACRKAKRSRCPRGKELRAKARAKTRERATEKRRREEIAAQSNYFNPEVPATSAGGSISGESLAAIGKCSPFSGLSHLYYPGLPLEQNEMEDFEFCKSMWE